MQNYSRRTALAMIGASGIGGMWLVGHRADAAGRSYYQRVLAKRPVGYWRFGERTGSVALDSSGNRRDGGFRGEVGRAQPGPLTGESDVAIGLNGVNAYVEIPDSTVFSQPTSGQGLTVEVWMRPDLLAFNGQTDAHYVHWLGKGQPGMYEWGFRFYSQNSPRPNRISAYIWNASGPPGSANEGAGAYFQDDLRVGEWLHVVACFDPGNASDPTAGVSIYKNGVLRGNPAKTRGARYLSYNIHPARGGAPVRLGTRDLGSFLTGGLAEVAIYPRVLSAREVLDNYSGA